MFDLIVLIFGISGVVAVVTNFILEATDKLPKDHHLFAILNFYGAVALLVYSWYNQVWLFVVLNAFALLVGAYGLKVVYSKKK